MVHPPYVWVDTERDLERAAERLSQATSLAVDTEADSFYHYHHKCCLIQVSDGEAVYLVDPLALKRLQPLGEVLGSRRIVAAFLSCPSPCFPLPVSRGEGQEDHAAFS